MSPPSSTIYSKESIQIETIYPTTSTQVNSSYYSYHKIYEFILYNIVQNSKILSSCNMIDEDEDGNPSIEFYIKYLDDLTYSQRKKLTYDVLENIYNFCIDSGFQNKFHDISIFLIKQ